MPDAASTAMGFLDLNWAWLQLSGGDPVPFLSWTVAAFLIGFCVGKAFRSWRINRKIRSELGLRPGFERVNTVERLIEKADELAVQTVDATEKDAETESIEEEAERLRRQLQMTKVPGTVAGLRTMSVATSASTAAPGGDPLAALLPAEVELLLRVFDSGTVRLDDSTLPVAKSLADKGAIYRRDTHDSGVIVNCDVMLTSDWVPVVRERADELRGAEGATCSQKDAPAAADVGSTDGGFSTITPAQARILRNLFVSGSTHASSADGDVRSLLERGIIHVVGSDTRTPLTGDKFAISDEWTKRINAHYDEFKRHCSVKS